MNLGDLQAPTGYLKRPITRPKWSAASERKKYALVIYGDSGNLCEANLNASFMQKIFHITKRKRKPHIKHHSQADGLRARFKGPEWGVFCHTARLRNRTARLKLVLSDNAQQPSRATLSVRERPCRAVWSHGLGRGATKTDQNLVYAEHR